MNSRPNAQRPSEPLPEPSTIPLNGWHCGHYFYRFRREALTGGLSPECQSQLADALGADSGLKNERHVSYWISGHRADFCVMLMDPDPAKVDGVHQRHGTWPRAVRGARLVFRIHERGK